MPKVRWISKPRTCGGEPVCGIATKSFSRPVPASFTNSASEFAGKAGFAASTKAVGNHHFDQLFKAYIESEEVRAFMSEKNPAALRETVARFQEAIRRGLWTPRSNSAADLIRKLLPQPQRESAA